MVALCFLCEKEGKREGGLWVRAGFDLSPLHQIVQSGSCFPLQVLSAVGVDFSLVLCKSAFSCIL